MIIIKVQCRWKYPAEQDCVKYALEVSGKRVDMPMGGEPASGANPGFVGQTATNNYGVAGGIVGGGQAAANARIGWRLSKEEIALRKGFLRESMKVETLKICFKEYPKIQYFP